ncbi:hypothetical protein ACFLTJ_03155 [Chloroflexota bacterium]
MDFKDYHWFVGQGLARQLPFKKRHGIIGEKVCEWGIVMPMAKAAFMVGCALAIMEPKSADYALQYSTQPKSWKDAYNTVVDGLVLRLATSTENTSYEDLFPEWRQPSTPKETLMNKVDCINAIGQRVIVGLATGLLNSRVGTQIIEPWVSQKPIEQNLGIRGFSVQEDPESSSVEDTRQHAKILYDTWKSQVS